MTKYIDAEALKADITEALKGEHGLLAEVICEIIDKRAELLATQSDNICDYCIYKDLKIVEEPCINCEEYDEFVGKKL